MRILHVSEAFGGGLLEVVNRLACGAVERGHETAIAYGCRPETPRSVRQEIDERVALFAVVPWRRGSPVSQLAAARQLRRLVRSWEPDLVHLHSSFAGVVGAVALASDVPTIFSPHAYASALPNERPSRRAVFRAAERIASRRVALVGAVSRSEARFAVEQAGARHVEVVENGIRELDRDQLVERPLPHRPRIVGVGRTVPQRQPVACARILSRVADIADVAWIGGGGGNRGAEGHAALTNAGIHLTGWRPRDEAIAELGAATAYLHWTSWDGQPLSILEAMAMDVVVVASDIEPNREVLGRDAVCSSEEQAVDLLRRVAVDREFAETLRSSQRKRRLHYGASRMVDEWLQVYDRLVSR